MNAGGGIGTAVLEPGMDTVAAGDFREPEFVKADIMAAEMGAVSAGRFVHLIHLKK